ncbi:hypothetical protein HF521_011763 [Silurus meridionalis]|uniref:MIF4G domain-containing protein n=1 Tax=Silurus meridionalis TaxID=175797 RepID=A0A8T0AEW2_SILME|nr:hypothetical protein HF521_011763 [Silurus meridionalis]
MSSRKNSRNWKQLFQPVIVRGFRTSWRRQKTKLAEKLFKFRMFTESIIHNCVVKLLKQNDEESLECLSILLTTAGKEMDFKKAKDKPELAFQQSDFDLEPVLTTVENSSVSPVIVEHLASAETPADEIEAQEAEPPKNEPEPSSEDESNDGVLSPVEEPNNNTMHTTECNLEAPSPCKFLLNVPMNEEVELKKAEDAWKPSMKRRNSTEDPETQKTEELFPDGPRYP